MILANLEEIEHHNEFEMNIGLHLRENVKLEKNGMEKDMIKR